MITKEQYVEELRNEMRIMKHLATKVPAGTWDWRPSPVQRSTIELLRYLTCSASVPVSSAVKGNWDDAGPLEKAAESVTPETFAAAMDAQMALVESLLAPLTPVDMLERDATLPWGKQIKLGVALISMGLKPLVAYRMQLFLYAKQSGNHEIGPANCWIGVDAPKPSATAAPTKTAS